MRYVTHFFLLLLIMGCGQGKKYHEGTEDPQESPLIAEILEFQEELDESFIGIKRSIERLKFLKMFVFKFL